MKIVSGNTDLAVLDELGRRIARARLERNLTQAQLAAKAGVGRATLQRLESGQDSELSTLIRTLRALGLLELLDRLVPEPPLSPIELLKLQGRERRRARSRVDSPTSPPAPPWRWGDES
ncbi:MAG: helix-turn-helix transcriptional regulator [Candidatus Dormibacterales bacterium]